MLEPDVKTKLEVAARLNGRSLAAEINNRLRASLENEPALSFEDYEQRAKPRLAMIDALAKKINFESMTWQHTPEGERYMRLMQEQCADECAAGL